MKKIIRYILVIFISATAYAQVGIGTDNPDASAILHLNATDKGFLPPVMNNITDIRTNIANPATGLLVYDLEERCYRQYNGENWECVVETVQGQNPNRATLACNGDLLSNSADVVAETLGFISLDTTPGEESVYTSGCTTPAADGNDVSCVTNFSTSNLTDLQPVLGANPASLVASNPDANGFPTLTFDSSNSEAMFITNSDSPIGVDFSFLFYVRTTATAASAVIVSGLPHNPNGDTTNGNNTTWQIGVNQAANGYQFRGNGFNIDFATLSELNDGNFHLIAMRYDHAAQTMNIFVDGVEKVNTSVATSNFRSGMFRFGVNRANFSYVDMELADVLVGSASLTDAQFDEAQAYFLCKYGLDASVFAGDQDFFPVVEELYQQNSQFELRTFRTPVTLDVIDLATDPTGATTTPVTDTEFVYDFLNEQYYTIDVTPTPGLGISRNTATNAITEEALPDFPDTDGNYRLKLDVSSGGTVTNLRWEVQ